MIHGVMLVCTCRCLGVGKLGLRVCLAGEMDQHLLALTTIC